MYKIILIDGEEYKMASEFKRCDFAREFIEFTSLENGRKVQVILPKDQILVIQSI